MHVLYSHEVIERDIFIRRQNLFKILSLSLGKFHSYD
jgi:hypothetical protein